MKIVLYRTSYKKTDVVKPLNAYTEYTCTLRFPTNILNPIVRIEIPSGGNHDWSYAYIKEFGDRYYFVENIVAFTNNLFDLYLHVDVLFTYIGVNNGKLRNQVCWITRSSDSTIYNKLLMDSKVTYQEKNNIFYYELNNSSSFKYDNLSSNSRNVLVNVICDMDLTNYVGYDISRNKVPSQCYYPTVSSGIEVSPRETNYNSGSITYLLTAEQARALAQECLKSTSTRSYIKSFIVFPFDLTQSSYGTNYSVISTTGTITFGVANDYHFVTVPQDVPQNIYICSQALLSFTAFHCIINTIRTNINIGTDYTDYSSYSKYELYIPYVGYVDIDWNFLQRFNDSDTFLVMLNTDLETGNTTYDIIIGGIPYKSQQVKIGLNINLSSTNLYENEQLKNAITTQEVATSVASGLAIIGGALVTIFSSGGGSGVGLSMMLGGLGGYASGIITGEGNRAKIIDYGSSGTSSATDGVMGLHKFIWRITKLVPSYDRFNSNIINEIGIPCMKTTIVSSCRGYNEFGKCEFSLSNVKEEEELEELLSKGVHFPTNTW